MKFILSLSTIYFCVALSVGIAQGVRGNIQDINGESLPYATIYIQETGSGTAANESGFYQINLSPGDYTLVFQHLGHKTVVEKIAIGDRMRDLTVKLEPQSLDLQLVDVYDGRENPAYTVMRKAIAKAEYHRKQLEYYSAQVYIKGSGRLRKYPKLFKKVLEEENIDTSSAFTQESVSEITYHRPNTYKERVISIYTQGDDNGSSPNGYFTGSFYNNKVAGAISPLSTKAFAYYKFEHAGFFMDREYGVNKIKVIPRSGGDGVFEGFLYIVEDYWSIYRLELETWKTGIKYDVEQVYAPIQEKVWMQASLLMKVNVKMFGFWVDYQYQASVSNYDIELNSDLDHEFVVIDEKIDSELAAAAAKAAKESEDLPVEERLARGDELTRKDLRRIIRDYDREERKRQKEPRVIKNREYKIDSLARDRDSSYWEAIRPIPLNSYEVKGYLLQDSLAKVENEKQEAEENGDKVSSSSKGNFVRSILVGGSKKLGEGTKLYHQALSLNFNPVEGFVGSKNVGLRFGDKRHLHTSITPRYAVARKRFSMKGLIGYRFGKKRRQHFGIRGGRYVNEFNSEGVLHPLVNSISSLFYHRNYLRLFEREFAGGFLRYRPLENYQLNAALTYARRYRLTNQTSQTFFPREDRAYASNTPINKAWNGTFLHRPERALTLEIDIKARPWQRYQIYNGQKYRSGESTPELKFSYRAGLDGDDLDTDYHRIEGEIAFKKPLGVRGDLGFRAFGGLYLTNDAVGFADYRHFPGNETTLSAINPVDGYRLLPYYTFSTDDRYAGLFTHFQFRKLLLTRIMEVRLLGVKENVFVNHLMTPEVGQYTEVGYSIDNILRALRLELAFSFQDGQYRDWGLLVGVSTTLSD